MVRRDILPSRRRDTLQIDETPFMVGTSLRVSHPVYLSLPFSPLWCFSWFRGLYTDSFVGRRSGWCRLWYTYIPNLSWVDWFWKDLRTRCFGITSCLPIKFNYSKHHPTIRNCLLSFWDNQEITLRFEPPNFIVISKIIIENSKTSNWPEPIHQQWVPESTSIPTFHWLTTSEVFPKESEYWPPTATEN